MFRRPQTYRSAEGKNCHTPGGEKKHRAGAQAKVKSFQLRGPPLTQTNHFSGSKAQDVMLFYTDPLCAANVMTLILGEDFDDSEITERLRRATNETSVMIL